MFNDYEGQNGITFPRIANQCLNYLSSKKTLLRMLEAVYSRLLWTIFFLYIYIHCKCVFHILH